MTDNIYGDIDLRAGVVPISKAAATLAELIRRVQTERQPLVVTQKGYPAAVILDVETYSDLRDFVKEHEKSAKAQATKNQPDEA